MVCPNFLFPRHLKVIQRKRLPTCACYHASCAFSASFLACIPSLIFQPFSLRLNLEQTQTRTHSKVPKHKKSRPQLRQAIALTIQSVFFPMMFPIGTGRRKSDLLPHRAHAVPLIWKMISVLLEPINIILVSPPVNDTFLPSIVECTEEGVSVRRGGGRGVGGRGDVSSRASHTTGESFTSQTAS